MSFVCKIEKYTVAYSVEYYIEVKMTQLELPVLI